MPGYVSGRLLPAFALSEPGAGSDAAAITTTARRDGNHYVINGRKTWTSNCGLADLYVVFARMEEQAGPSGIAAFAIDGRDSSIALEERLSVLPPHTVGTWTLKDCRVPSQHLIGELGQGFQIAMKVLELFRPTVGAATLGFARRAMSEAIERSVSRSTFKKPISEHQLIQAKLAEMAVGIDAAALLVYRAASDLASFEGRRWNVCFGIPGRFGFSMELAKFSSSSLPETSSSIDNARMAACRPQTSFAAKQQFVWNREL